MNTDKIYAESLANEYAPKDTAKVVALRKLDRKAKLPASIFAYTFGILTALVAGVGMCHRQAHSTQEGKEKKDIDGFSPLQRFYLAYANVWASNIRDEEILARTKTDPHSLGENRVNVTLRNIEPFFEAFGIKEGDKMFRPENERVIIW